VPSIFNPWDLQHLHHPEFFSAPVLANRAAAYPVHCRRASAVVTASRWTRHDVIDRYDIEPGRVYVIPLAAATTPTVTAEDIGHVRSMYRLPDMFALYPAQTWPHKNHLRLIEALALIRDRYRLRVPLVCTGARNGFWPTIAKRVEELKLRQDALFLGFVPDRDLATLYRLASFVVIPSLFEGWGFPVIEAFQAGAPLTSSDATALREYAGGAALLFDPTSVDSIAEAVVRMATDGELRRALSQQGRDRATMFSWGRAAKTHRALYRRVVGRELSDEDAWLLQQSA
jgi:glycosyltransferase involved in cell wall biosynthesis